MGSKPKLIDTSGSRLPKKNKINEAELTVANNELQLNENPIGGTTPVEMILKSSLMTEGLLAEILL